MRINFLVIYFCIINDLKMYWPKTIVNICHSFCQKGLGINLAMRFWLEFFVRSSQLGCGHLKVSLAFENLLPKWLTHRLAGLSSAPYTPPHRVGWVSLWHTSYLIPEWSKRHHGEKLQCLLWPNSHSCSILLFT